jgi:hypothetical protein
MGSQNGEGIPVAGAEQGIDLSGENR